MLFAYLNQDVPSLKVCILIEEFELDCRYFIGNSSSNLSSDMSSWPLLIDKSSFINGTEDILIHLAEKWDYVNRNTESNFKIASWLIQLKSISQIEIDHGCEGFAGRWPTTLEHINNELKIRGFLTGEDFTIADISFWAELHRVKINTENWGVDKYKYIAKFYEHGLRRNSVIRALNTVTLKTMLPPSGANSGFLGKLVGVEKFHAI